MTRDNNACDKSKFHGKVLEMYPLQQNETIHGQYNSYLKGEGGVAHPELGQRWTKSSSNTMKSIPTPLSKDPKDIDLYCVDRPLCIKSVFQT